MRFFKLISVFFFCFFILNLVTPVFAVEKISPDPRGVELVNKLVAALLIQDPDARVKAVIPLVHKSLLNNDGTDLSINVKPWSYKKAYQNVKFYCYPVKIHEVHKGRVYTIGFKETAEKGRTDKYFVKKKPGVNGMPAPVHVFFPSDGGDPKVVNMGSF